MYKKSAGTTKSTNQGTTKGTTLEFDEFSGPISIRNTKKRFYTRTKTAYHLNRKPVVDDDFIELLEDYFINLRGKNYKSKQFNNMIYSEENDNENNCICKNLKKMDIDNSHCNCDNLSIIKSNSPFSLSKKYIIQCKNNTNTKKNSKLSSKSKHNARLLRKDLYLNTSYATTNTIKLIKRIKDTIFLRLNNYTHEIIVNKYISKILPTNTIKIIDSGICNRNNYLLYNEGELEEFEKFMEKLFNRELDDEFEIYNSDHLYKAIVNLLLQVILIFGHLNTSNIHFINNNFTTKSLMIKRVPISSIKKFNFIIHYTNAKNNKDMKYIKLKNMGFSVLLTDMQNASILLSNSLGGDFILLPSSIDYKNYNYTNNSLLLKKLFNKLEKNKKYKDYFLEKKIDKTILSFMKPKDIFDKIDKIDKQELFNDSYLEKIDLLNYHLFP